MGNNKRQKISCHRVEDFEYLQIVLLSCNVVESNSSDEDAERGQEVN